MKLGVWLDVGSRIRPLSEQLTRHRAVVHEAEAIGYESVWIGESFSTGSVAPFQWLAALAPDTTLRIGTGVLLLPAWHPLRLAYEVAFLDQLSDGRLEVGVGVGRAALQKRFGIPPSEVAVRADETLEALRRMWSGNDKYDGEHVHLSLPLDPSPRQRGGPRLWVGGSVKRSVARAARFGDGWYASTTYSYHHIALQIQRYRSELQAASGLNVEPQIAVNRLLLLSETDEEAEKKAESMLGPTLLRYARNGSLGVEWRDTTATAPEIFRALRAEFTVVGSPETAGAELRRYRQIGVNHLHARLLPEEVDNETAMQSLHFLNRAMELM